MFSRINSACCPNVHLDVSELLLSPSGIPQQMGSVHSISDIPAGQEILNCYMGGGGDEDTQATVHAATLRIHLQMQRCAAVVEAAAVIADDVVIITIAFV